MIELVGAHEAPGQGQRVTRIFSLVAAFEPSTDGLNRPICIRTRRHSRSRQGVALTGDPISVKLGQNAYARGSVPETTMEGWGLTNG